MEKIKIGKIVNAVGLKGELKVYSYSDYKERFEELDSIFAGEEQEEYEIENVRYQKDMVILKLEGVSDRNQAEAMKDKDIFIAEEDLRELPAGTFYIKDLIGLKAIDDTDGTEIGCVTDVTQNTPQDIYVIKTAAGGQVLIPAVKEFVKEINPQEGYIKITPIPGLIDLGKAVSDSDED